MRNKHLAEKMAQQLIKMCIRLKLTAFNPYFAYKSN